MKRIVNRRPFLLTALLATGAFLSCDLTDSGEPAPAAASGSVAYVPRLVTRSGAALPAVDSVRIRLWIGDTSGRRPFHDRTYAWSDSDATVGELPVDSRYTVIVEGIRRAMDSTSRAIWWSASKTGLIQASETSVYRDDLLVREGDMALPEVQIPSGSMTFPLGADSLTLQFTTPSDAESLYIDGQRQSFSAGGQFSKTLLAGHDSVKRVSVRLVDGNANVWKGVFEFRREAMVPASDSLGPEIELLSPRVDTSLPSGTASWLVRLRARDPSGVQDVVIQDSAAVLGADTVWSAEVALATDSNTIRIVATDAYGRQRMASVKIVVIRNPGLRLARLGQSFGTVEPPGESDTTWTLTVPNADSTVSLDPRPLDSSATIWREGLAVAQPIVLSFGPGGDSQDVVLAVRAGDSTRNWRVRVVHLPPGPIALVPVGGAAPRFPYADTAATFAWTVRGTRAIGRITIQGAPVVPVGDTCRLRVSMPEPKLYPIVIAAHYEGLESLVWRDTIRAERMTPPDANDARLLNFGYDLPVQLVDGDSIWNASLGNDVDSVTLVPIPAYAGATAAFWPDGEKKRIVRFKVDGDTIEDLRVEVVAENKRTRMMHRLRIEHAPPSPIDLVPEHGAERLVPFDSSSVVLRWSIQGSRPLGAVTVGNDTLPPVSAGRYEHTLHLPHAGRYGVRIRASYRGGALVWSDSVTVEREDTLPPAIVMGNESSFGQIVGIAKRSFPLQWAVLDNDSVVSVTLNGAAVAPIAGGTYAKTLPLVADTNHVTIVARDLAGLENRRSGILLLDSAKPEIGTGLKVDTVEIPLRMRDSGFTATVTVTDNYGLDSIWVGREGDTKAIPIEMITRRIDGGPLVPIRTIWYRPITSYPFSHKFALVAGTNALTVLAKDIAGNLRLVKLVVIVR